MNYEINIKNDYAELIFNHPKYGLKKVLVDVDDLNKIKNKTIHIYFAKNEFRARFGTHITLHRFLMNCPKGMIVDHVNHNTLDNRKSNLRICTQKENQRNRTLSKNNKSGYSGIRYRNNAYEVEIGKNRKYLGRFKEIEKAIKVRNDYLLQNGYLINESEV